MLGVGELAEVGVNPRVFKEEPDPNDITVERGCLFRTFGPVEVPPSAEMDGFCLGFNQNVAFFIPSFQTHHNKMGFLELLIY